MTSWTEEDIEANIRMQRLIETIQYRYNQRDKIKAPTKQPEKPYNSTKT